MKNMFRDAKMQETFERMGYVTVDFLNAAEVEQMKNAYFELESIKGGMRKEYDVTFDTEHEITYDFTFTDSNPNYKQAVFDRITDLFMPIADQYLNNYQPIIANFINKNPSKGEVPLHQNWAFVDEYKYTSVSVWCPLVDSNIHNGTLQMVDGSHKRFAPVRGPLIPWELEDLKDTIIKEYLVPMNIKAGQAVILDDSIIHYSALNNTNGLRLAIQLIMIPGNTHSIHYHLDSTGEKPMVRVYKVDKDFYMQFHPWLKPKDVEELEAFEYNPKRIDKATFDKMLKGKAIDQPKGILDNILSLFN
ncbi:MAG: phytanoyl-CoA dioxygenase family protein [Chitinophagales bacterium]|nr:phytanoyl-CoA dioxygenase family protein [Chitinophagales bacterium]